MPAIVASIEARMGSSRLPGKVLADINGQPALTRLLRRLRRCEGLDDIVLATSREKNDDPLAAWAATEQVAVFRGSENDVLERVVQAHQYMGSEIIVEVTGDCPLLDPEIIDLGIQTFLANRGEVVSNTWQLTYPMGVDVQVFRRAALEEVAATVTDPAVREHVSLYFYEHPEKYRLIHLVAPRRWQAPEWRFQLDYPEDLAFIREVYRALEPAHGDAFGLPEIFQLLRERPELLEINRGCREKAVR